MTSMIDVLSTSISELFPQSRTTIGGPRCDGSAITANPNSQSGERVLHVSINANFSVNTLAASARFDTQWQPCHSITLLQYGGSQQFYGGLLCTRRQRMQFIAVVSQNMSTIVQHAPIPSRTAYEYPCQGPTSSYSSKVQVSCSKVQVSCISRSSFTQSVLLELLVD